jgi:NAD(P)-dependent dehydrogenase (short-subunit alcohol dehydrogenase family)
MSAQEIFRLDGKAAAVTGAGSGIGAAIAELFAARGARVALLDVDLASAQSVADRVRAAGGTAEAFACDVGERASVEAAFAALERAFARLDVLVNNAGVAHVGTVETTSDADFARVMRVNVTGMFLCTQAALPRLKASGRGAILNLASIASLIGVEERFAYSVSKGAVLALTRSVAVDLMKHGVRCNCVCPARVHTPFVDGYLKRSYPGREAEMFAKLSQYQPIGRMGRPEEVAQMALYLCSDEAAFVTGQAFPIDGGVLLR